MINYDPFGVAPYFASRPESKPTRNGLYNPVINIDIGSAEIYERWAMTGDDPILVAAAFNSGGIRSTTANRWRLKTTGNHLDRAAGFYGDACAVLSELRGEGNRPRDFHSDLINGPDPKLATASDTEPSARALVAESLLVNRPRYESEEYKVHELGEHEAEGIDIAAEIEAAEAIKAMSFADFVATLPVDVFPEDSPGGEDQDPLLDLLGVRDGDYMEDFKKFIEKLEIEFFKPHEFLHLGGFNRPGQKCEGLNRLPPRRLWKHVANTALMIDEIRRRLKAPVVIMSSYRSEKYNKCVGGVSRSLHKKFNALDWVCKEGSVYDWWRVATEVRQANPNFIGGIGRYTSRVHIDTRGKEANW